jgi:hypothetical protein
VSLMTVENVCCLQVERKEKEFRSVLVSNKIEIILDFLFLKTSYFEAKLITMKKKVETVIEHPITELSHRYLSLLRNFIFVDNGKTHKRADVIETVLCLSEDTALVSRLFFWCHLTLPSCHLPRTYRYLRI